MHHHFGEDRRNHGRQGRIRASRRDTGAGDPNTWRVTDRAYRAAVLAQGFKALRDQNIEDDVDGLAPTCFNTVDRERWNSAFGYMDAPTRSRPNLRILAESEARHPGSFEGVGLATPVIWKIAESPVYT